MKKGLLLLTAGLLLCASPANAQLGGLLKKSAQKAVQQQTDRLLNKGSESATDTQPIETPSGEEGLPTYAELMAQMPALPTAQQLVSYKEAELNEQTMKMMLSPVTNFNSMVLSLSMQADEQCRAIYKKYAATLAKTEGKNRNRLLINYYTEILPIRIPVVQQAMQLRLTSQLPIAEEIEKGMAGIRAAHPETLTSLVNYPQMTATQYFAEVAKLLEIPEYVEEQ